MFRVPRAQQILAGDGTHSHLLLWHEVLEHLGTLSSVSSAEAAWQEEMVGAVHS